MRIIRKRAIYGESFHSDDYEQQRLREVANERCGLCWDVWPASVMVTEDGRRRCPDCLYKDDTEEAKARIQADDTARIAARQTRPQISLAPLDDSTPPHIRIMETAAGVRVTQNAPLVLVRGGSAVELIIKGGGFAATDEFSYSSGVSDDIDPSLSGSTQWTLTLAAAGGTTAGDKHLTYNNHTYRGILRVG